MPSGWQRYITIIVTCLPLLLGTQAFAQANLTVDAAQRLAYGLLDRRQYGAAIELLNTLQADDRNQTAILFIARSRAHRGLGQTREAIQNGRIAFRLAQNDAEKFAAARTTAQAYSTAGNRITSQIWLRLASQYAPNERAYNLARRDFEYVRARNPISLNFNLSIQPTDNINNAPTDNSFTFLGTVFTDPTLRPISGVSFQTTTELTYRLPATSTRTSQLEFAHFGRRVSLGSEAENIDPDLSARDLATDRYLVAWANDLRRPDRPWVIDTTVDAFADWSGGEHIQNGWSVNLGYSLPLNPQQSLRIAADYEETTRLDRDVRSFEKWTALATWTGRFNDIGRFQVNARYEDVSSDSFAVARDQWSLAINYSLPAPVLGADLSLSALYSETSYDEPLFGPAARSDRTQVASLTAGFPSLEYLGFSPYAQLSNEHVDSNVSRFETDTFNFGVSIRSNF